MKLFTHLNFGGNCEAAFRFYEKHLGGKITMMMRVSDLPPGVKPPDEPTTAVIHARMDIDGVELIGNDVPAKFFQQIRSSYLYLAVDSTDEAERVYKILSDGGTVGSPIAETFFATRYAQVRDKFGVLWTILRERPR